jgi:hypothetical protein
VAMYEVVYCTKLACSLRSSLTTEVSYMGTGSSLVWVKLAYCTELLITTEKLLLYCSPGSQDFSFKT